MAGDTIGLRIPCGKGDKTGKVVVGITVWSLYSIVMVGNFYDTNVSHPRTQRVPRENRELQLPRLYICPADRGQQAGFRWQSYECGLSFRGEHRSCPGRLEAYRGREPEAFKRTPDGDFTADENGGSCLEFGTHMVGVREEWSAAWNQLILRAAFHPPKLEGAGDVLQEVEIGYMPVEWEVGSDSKDRYYYPLLRVPFFYLTRGYLEPGVATRIFLSRERDKGIASGGEYWFSYGAMQIAVVNATLPQESLSGAGYTPPDRLAVVHVIITLEDFNEFDYEEVGSFLPLLEVLGNIAGVGALIVLVLRCLKIRTKSQAEEDAAGEPHEYRRVERHEDSADEEEALLGSGEPQRAARRDGEERPASQALLCTEEGVDGL